MTALAKVLTDTASISKTKLKPATPQDLTALRAIGKVPKQLLELYQVAGNIETFGDWLGIKSALRERKFLLTLPEFPTQLVPIETDGGGNFSCFDLTMKKILDWDHETRKTRVLAKDLTAFVEERLLRPLTKLAATR